MFVLGAGDTFSVALVNAILIASWAALPILLLSYTRQSLAVRRSRPDFSLRRSEAGELDRAALLYGTVRRRLQEIDDLDKNKNARWRLVLGFAGELRRHHADELDDLEAHAWHLRAIIIRLNRRPLDRLKSWVHAASSRFALGYALAAYVVGFALLVVAFHFSGQTTDALTSGLRTLLLAHPPDQVSCANVLAAGFAAMAVPGFYLLRRVTLHQTYRFEFGVLKQLARTDPVQIVDQSRTDQGEWHQAESIQAEAGGDCFAILGVSDAATVEEVKDAYKALIKQNHPDRVHDMSPAFRQLAEVETKKLNAAYREALVLISPFEPGRATAPH